MLTALGPKEAGMQMIGCDLHARQQTMAMLAAKTGMVVEKILVHQASNVWNLPEVPIWEVAAGLGILDGYSTVNSRMLFCHAATATTPVFPDRRKLWRRGGDCNLRC